MSDPITTTRHVFVYCDRESYSQPWSVQCHDCPLKPLALAAGEKPPTCAAGLMTNVQGAVPVQACKHYVRESITIESGKVTLKCLLADHTNTKETA